MPDDFKYSGKKSLGPKPYSGYASKEITVSGAAVDYSLKDNTELFSVVMSPVEFLLRNGSTNISFKFNSNENDVISLSGNTDFGVQGFIVNDIFVTTSGLATFEVFTLGWQ
jgi:hypothetical protein